MYEKEIKYIADRIDDLERTKTVLLEIKTRDRGTRDLRNRALIDLASAAASLHVFARSLDLNSEGLAVGDPMSEERSHE